MPEGAELGALEVVAGGRIAWIFAVSIDTSGGSARSRLTGWGVEVGGGGIPGDPGRRAGQEV